MLLDGTEITEVSIMTPKGETFDAEILDIQRTDKSVKCAVRKDGGDDPDVTSGALIYAEVSLSDHKGIRLAGGEGVGRRRCAALHAAHTSSSSPASHGARTAGSSEAQGKGPA